jgi:hypothetical protein
MFQQSLFVSTLAALFLTGCATLFQGTNEEIMVESDPSAAQISVNDGRQGTTPFSMRTNRNDDLQIHVSKPGYAPADITDGTHLEWGYLISDIFFTGLIGLAVDGMDGAMFYHNQTMVTAHLEPVAMAPMQSGQAQPPIDSRTASTPAVAHLEPVAAAPMQSGPAHPQTDSKTLFAPALNPQVGSQSKSDGPH